VLRDDGADQQFPSAQWCEEEGSCWISLNANAGQRKGEDRDTPNSRLEPVRKPAAHDDEEEWKQYIELLFDR